MNPDIFHITDIKNLPTIIRAEGIVCKRILDEVDYKYRDAAYQSIQDTRSRKEVPCGPGGTIHDYVPFYFCPRSPMLCAIAGGYVETYKGDQSKIIHLVSDLAAIEQSDVKYVFTDGHATKAFTQFYDDKKNLDKLDWKTIESTWWNDTPEDPDRKRRKQAELLAFEFVPWACVRMIGVISDSVKDEVAKILDDSGNSHKPRVLRKKNEYYYDRTPKR